MQHGEKIFLYSVIFHSLLVSDVQVIIRRLILFVGGMRKVWPGNLLPWVGAWTQLGRGFLKRPVLFLCWWPP